MQTNNDTVDGTVAGSLTRQEIFQQPELWLITRQYVLDCGWKLPLDRPLVVTGAGTSAYAAAAVANAGQQSVAVPTTDLLTASIRDIERLCPGFSENGMLLSLARSGDSPESLGVVERMRQLFPSVEQYAITCNREGGLARDGSIRSLLLDPRTNDRSLAMTSSFTNLVLAGMLLLDPALETSLASIARRATDALPELCETASAVATDGKFTRAVVLADAALRPAAMEAALKILEMSAGDVLAIPETYLGLRHGPMSFLRSDSLILCLLASDVARRSYEVDLIRELRRKELGYVVAVTPSGLTLPDHVLTVPAIAPELSDRWRTPFEILFAQLLAYSISLRGGHDPDNPSPAGVITRVVPGFRLHSVAG